MHTTFTLTRTGSRIEGFNDRGQCFTGVYNAGGKWNVGTTGYTSHDTRTSEVGSREEAIAWVVDKLLNCAIV